MDNLIIASNILLWVVVLLNLLLTLGLIRWANTLQSKPRKPEVDMLQPREALPDFSLNTIDGKVHSLANYSDRWLTLVFVSPTCLPCRQKMPVLRNLYSSIRKKGGELILVSIGETDQSTDFIKEFGMEALTVLLTDRRSDFMGDYKVIGTPSYYVVDRLHKIESGGFFDEDWERLVSDWTKES